MKKSLSLLLLFFCALSGVVSADPRSGGSLNQTPLRSQEELTGAEFLLLAQGDPSGNERRKEEALSLPELARIFGLESFAPLMALLEEQARAEAAEEANANAITANAAALTEEQARAEAAEAANAGAITANTAALTAEQARAEAAEEANADAITANSAALTAEQARAEAAEAANADAITANTAALTAEQARAEAAEVANTDAITANTAALTAEQARAEAAEAANTDAITANTAALTAEQARAEAAEVANANAITANAAALTAEQARAEAAEAANADAITANTAALTAEQARAEAAEAARLSFGQAQDLTKDQIQQLAENWPEAVEPSSETLLFHSWDDSPDSTTNDLGLADTGQNWVVNGSGAGRARVLGGRYTQEFGSTGGAVYAWPNGSAGLVEAVDYYAWAASWEEKEGGSGPATSAFVVSPKFGFGAGAENLLHIVYGNEAFRVEIFTNGLPGGSNGQVNVVTLSYEDPLALGADHLHEVEFLGDDTIKVTLGSSFDITAPASDVTVKRINDTTVLLTYAGIDDARAGRFPAWEWIITDNPTLRPGARWVYAGKKRSIDFEFLSRRAELTGGGSPGGDELSGPIAHEISTLPTSQVGLENLVFDEIHINLSDEEWDSGNGFFSVRLPTPQSVGEGGEIKIYDTSHEMRTGNPNTRFVNLLNGSLYGAGWDFSNPTTGAQARFQGEPMILRSNGTAWLILR